MESINNDAQNSKQPDVLYTLSNVNLFRKCIVEADVLGSLVALGSDCVNLTQCQVSMFEKIIENHRISHKLHLHFHQAFPILQILNSGRTWYPCQTYAS